MVIAIYNNTGPCYHRIFVPLSAIPDLQVKFTNHVIEEDAAKCSAIYFNRIFPTNKLSEILRWKHKYGFKLICDLDDHWDLDPNHALFTYYKKTNLSNYILQSVISSDAVSVTHERLADAVLPYNRNIWILPNAIDDQHPQFQQQHTLGEKVRLFWAGGITHEHDIAILRNPMKRISADTYLTHRSMVVMGGYVEGYEPWKRMVTSFTNGFKMPGVILNGKEVNEYYSLYQYADICLVPLQQSRFNSFKSNLKILEAANIGVPVVVSNVHPYKGFPPEIVNYVDSQTDWYKYVRHLVRYEDFRIEQGRALKDYCKQVYNFDKINEARCAMITE
jgi:glycosyltransferase involved in cell wall biosynthesis